MQYSKRLELEKMEALGEHAADNIRHEFYTECLQINALRNIKMTGKKYLHTVPNNMSILFSSKLSLAWERETVIKKCMTKLYLLDDVQEINCTSYQVEILGRLVFLKEINRYLAHTPGPCDLPPQHQQTALGFLLLQFLFKNRMEIRVGLKIKW